MECVDKCCILKIQWVLLHLHMRILICISTFIQITQEVMFSSEIPVFSSENDSSDLPLFKKEMGNCIKVHQLAKLV